MPLSYRSHIVQKCDLAGRIVGLVAVLLVLQGCQLSYKPLYDQPATPAARATRVLFIGNSLSYYNDLPGLLAMLSRGQARPIWFQSEMVAGRSLKGHWQSGAAVRTLRRRQFDVVVVQDYSIQPAVNARESIDYFVRFDREIRASGARMLIFENWTRSGRASDATRLAETYRRVRTLTGAPSAPVGEAWRRSRRDHPEIRLLVDDRHPTPAGTYLAACVIYQTIYGSPVAAESPLPSNLLPHDAAILREIAAQTVGERSQPPLVR